MPTSRLAGSAGSVMCKMDFHSIYNIKPYIVYNLMMSYNKFCRRGNLIMGDINGRE